MLPTAVAQRRRHREPTPEETIAAYGDESRYHLYLRSNPIAFSRVVCGIVPNTFQTRVLTCTPPLWESYSILCPGRQYGKSLITAVYLLWAMVGQPDFRAFIMAPSGKQSSHILTYMTDLLEKSAYAQTYIEWQYKGDTLSIGGKDWGSQCTLIRTGLHGGGARGASTRGSGLVVWDEFSTFYDSAEIKQVTGVLSASGGGQLIVSSPSWVGSHYHRLYTYYKDQHQAGNTRYQVFDAEWTDTNHITAEWISEQRTEAEATGSLSLFEREVLGQWVTPSNAFWSEDLIRRCEAPALPRLTKGDTKVWAMDLGGRKSPAVIMLSRYNPALRRLEVTDCLSYVLKGNTYIAAQDAQTIRQHQELVDVCMGLRDTYGKPQVFYYDPRTENSIGEQLENLGLPMEPVNVGSYPTKLAMLRNLERRMSQGELVWQDQSISDEFRAFAPPLDADGRYDFPDKMYDKIFCAGCLAEWFGDNRPSIFAVRRIARWE